MRLRVLVTAALVACGAPREPAPAPAGAASSIPTPTAAATPAASAAPPPTAREGDDVFAKARADLIACYEDGRRAVPTMTSGKITFHVSVDASGKTACVVPSDDTGLTQEVENCMRTRLDAVTHARRESPWSFALPIVIREGELLQGEARTTPPSIETIESHGLAEDVYEVIERLLPDLYACTRGIQKSGELRMVYVGARVGANGQVECALASAPSSISNETRACTANVLGRAKFRPPKRGYGLVSVPLNVMSRN